MHRSKTAKYFRIFILMNLLILHYAEAADWLKLIDNSDETSHIDLDLASRQKAVEREARELTVFKNNKEISRQLQYAEYDCKGEKRRVIQTLIYKKNGDVTLITKPNAEWEPVAEDAKAKAFFESACSLR